MYAIFNGPMRKEIHEFWIDRPGGAENDKISSAVTEKESCIIFILFLRWKKKQKTHRPCSANETILRILSPALVSNQCLLWIAMIVSNGIHVKILLKCKTKEKKCTEQCKK